MANRDCANCQESKDEKDVHFLDYNKQEGTLICSTCVEAARERQGLEEMPNGSHNRD